MPTLRMSGPQIRGQMRFFLTSANWFGASDTQSEQHTLHQSVTIVIPFRCNYHDHLLRLIIMKLI